MDKKQLSDLVIIACFALYRIAILGLLYRIGSAILDQTKWLKDTDECDNIGNDSQ